MSGPRLNSPAVPDGLPDGERGESERPRDAQRDISRGLILYNRGCRTGAEDMYRLALKRDPGNTLARYLLGLALNALHRPEEARTEWRALLTDQLHGDKAAWAQRMAENLLRDSAGSDYTA